MPLYAENRKCFVLDAFDDTVMRFLDDAQMPARLVNGLMMIGIDNKFLTVKMAEQTILRNKGIM